MSLYVSSKGVDESDKEIEETPSVVSTLISGVFKNVKTMEDVMKLKDTFKGLLTALFFLVTPAPSDEVKLGASTLVDEVFDNFLPQVNIVALNNLYSSVTYHFPDLNFALLRAINKK